MQLNTIANYGIGTYTVETNYVTGGYTYPTTNQTAVSWFQVYPVDSQTTAAGQFYYSAATTYCVTTAGYAETEDQRIEREQRERDYAAKEKVRKARARAALVTVLTREQREQFEVHEHFELQVNGRLYRVCPGKRVERLDPHTKTVQSYFCIHPDHSHDLPSEDVAISQKLLLEANESEFLRIANETKAGPSYTCTPNEAAVALAA